MRILAPVRWIPWAAFGAAIACSPEAARPVEPDPPAAQDVDKIDPAVLSQLSGSAPVDVILLGADQWLFGPDGLAEYRAANEGLPRSTLRSDAGKEVAWNVIEIGAQAAWNDLGVTGDGIVIALMDTGIEYTHADLRDRIWRNPDEVPNNGLDDDANGYIDDLYGFDWSRASAEVSTRGQAHGAYVSGILVGDGSEGIVTGVAPGARVMATTFGTDTGAALAFEYALSEGADVVNMSFSIPNLGERRGFWRLMADHATAAGMVLVSGAGNFAQSQAVPVQLRIPEGTPSVVAVGGVDRSLQPVPFSSGGPVEWGSVSIYGDHPLPEGLTKPDVAAFPGPDFALVDPTGGYVNPNPSIRGNSFSGPQAAGVAALVLSARPELPAWRVKEILAESAVDIAEPGKDNRTGWGLLDAEAAVRAAVVAGGS